MSGDILEKQPSNTPEAAESAPSGAGTSPRKSLFGNLNSDLKQALNSWETLTEQMANKVSPDEEQLLEVKRLLGELKSKLNQFDE